VARSHSKEERGEAARQRGQFRHLLAILAGMLLGVAVGLLFGNKMWLAGGGPAAEIKTLAATAEQKAEHAAALEATNPKEAQRLRGHIPIVNRRLDEVRQLQAQVEEQGVSWLASAAWTTTKFLGDIFLQALKLLVIPLVFTSLVCGITSLGDVRKLGRMGFWTAFYFLSTTAVAVLIGTVLVAVIKPGVGADDTFAFVTESVRAVEEISPVEMLLDIVRGRPGEPGSGMIPGNIFAAAASKDTNVLALIFFALIFGSAVTTLGQRGKIVVDFLNSLNDAVMTMVHWVMWFAPLGIFSLMAFYIARKGGAAAFGEEMIKLGKYVGTVSGGLLLLFLFLCTLVWIFARRNPFGFVKDTSGAILTAMSTASSAATLPITFECAEDNCRISKTVTRFVLSLGATLNQNGTALYEAVAAIFIAQSVGMVLPLTKLIAIFVTVTVAATGVAAVPEAGLVTLVLVLSAVGLPIDGIGLILAIDWFLDRLRTSMNVYGDIVGAAIIDRYLKAGKLEVGT
jgi:Na+/H+-dicarboxylate symporter